MAKLLVVTPRFHGYGNSIAESFARLGHEAAVHHYDAVSSPVLKGWNKIRYELPSKFSGDDLHQSPRRVSELARGAIRAHNPDVVLVIRGDVLDADFWQEASRGDRRAAIWLYDEVRRTPRFDRAMVSQYARLATYSPLDAKALTRDGFETLYVPTGFDDRRPVDATSDAGGLVNFIGAVLPQRERSVRALIDAGVPVRAWGRGWSDHPVDRARTWRLHSRDVPNHRDVPASQALAVMRDSAATLNVHGDQDGFTMRTFESSAVGGVQLIDRPDVEEFYEPGREVLVFESDEELVELARRAVAHPEDFTQLRRRARERTMAEHTFVHRAKVLESLWQ